MTRTEVDPAVLGRTAARLREAVTVAGQVRRTGDAFAGPASAVGHAGLSTALQTFADRWQHGLGCLVEDAERLAVLLERAGRVYVEVEATVGRAAGGR